MGKFYNVQGESRIPLDSLPQGVTKVFGSIELVHQGDRFVPLLLARGPLADAGERHPLFLVDGVGFVSSPNGKGELLIWEGASGIEVDNEYVRLTGETALGRPMTIVLAFNRENIVVRTIKESEVWPRRVVRLAGAEGWAYPDCPVTQEAWKYVSSVKGPHVTDREIKWEVTFVGGRIISYEILVDTLDSWASIGDLATKDFCMLAMWPPVRIPGWRLYSAIITDDRPTPWLDGISTTIWLGPSTQFSKQARVVEKATLPGGVVTIALTEAEASMAPFYISLHGADCCGFYRMLREATGRFGEGPAILGLDLGTSTTVVAANNSSIVINDGDMAYPNTVVKNRREGLLTWDPWIPTVPGSYMDIAGLGAEIPTGLFVHPGHSPILPFSHFTITGAGLDLVNLPREWQEPCWFTDLKWGDTTDPQVRQRVVSFVSAVLLWCVALKRRQASNFTVRATYPLAFQESQKERYGRILFEACKLVTEWSGTSVNVAGKFSSSPEPFCDESVALLRDVDAILTDFEAVDTQRARLVFHADLGGATLDLLLALIFKDSFRVIAADSLKFGGNLLVENLIGATLPKEGSLGQESDIHRNQVVRAVRRGRLIGVMESIQNESRWDTDDAIPATYLMWDGAGESRQSKFKGYADIFSTLLAEYCGRFLAGALIDRDSFQFRVQHGPGRGSVPPTEAERGFIVLGRRSGNGWKFLQQSICGWTDRSWLKFFKERVKDLAAGHNIDLQFANIAKYEAVLGKPVTALGALSYTPDPPTRAEGQRAVVPVAAHPNGWDDALDGHDSSTGPWWLQVGPGSLCVNATAFGQSLDVEHRFYSDKRSQVAPIQDPSIPSTPGVCPRTNQGQEIWRRNWHDSFATDRAAILEWLQSEGRTQQREEADLLSAQGRVKGTAAVLWETYLKRLVEQKER